MNRSSHVTTAYSVLAVLLLSFVAAFFLLWPQMVYERMLIVGLSLSYVLWGCVTHVKTNRFTWQVAEEYLAVAFLGGMVLVLITFSVR